MEVGEYRVQRKIGEGGMGSVYAGIQPVIGKRVAIKVLAPHIASNPGAGAPVRRRGARGQQDRPPQHRRHLLVRLAARQAPLLRDGVPRRPEPGRSDQAAAPFQPDEARRLLRQICQALEAAHRQGIVHRDLKPDNILIVQPQHGDSYAKLLDFGIAKLMGDVDEGQRTQTGIVMGTPRTCRPSSAAA